MYLFIYFTKVFGAAYIKVRSIGWKGRYSAYTHQIEYVHVQKDLKSEY